MRLMSWNCQVGGFPRKAARVAPFRPDVLVVPECRDVVRVLHFDGAAQPTTKQWAGRPEWQRGTGVFSYSEVDLKPLAQDDRTIDGFAPFSCRQSDRSFQLVAVWTFATQIRATNYRQAHEGLIRYRDWITAGNTVIMGDFNNNQTYENGKPWADLMARMESVGLVSAYHEFFKEDFGKETRPTYFHKRQASSSWHVDYCFLPASWAPLIRQVQVGTHSDWSADSDHVPLIVDVDL